MAKNQKEEVSHKDLLASFANTKILVIGDLIIDIYRQGKPLGISVETPTIVIRHEKSFFSAGGAGLLVKNILALGGQATFISIIGDDEFTAQEKNLEHPNLKKVLIRDPERTTTVKERFWANDYKLLTWDRLDNRPISASLEKKILSFAKKNLKSFNKLVISDYRHGLLTKNLAQKLVRLAKNYKKPVFVDSQVSQSKSNHLWYQNADLFCLNVGEAKSIDATFDERRLRKSLARLQKILNTKTIILKRGEKGSVALVNHKFIETPALKVEAIDTTGAGDAFFAVIALSRDLTQKELQIANAWAGLSTIIIGTIPPKKEKLLDILEKNYEPVRH